MSPTLTDIRTALTAADTAAALALLDAYADSLTVDYATSRQVWYLCCLAGARPLYGTLKHAELTRSEVSAAIDALQDDRPVTIAGHRLTLSEYWRKRLGSALSDDLPF